MRSLILPAAVCGLLTVCGCTWNPGRADRFVPPGPWARPPAAAPQAPTPVDPVPTEAPLHGPVFPGAGLESGTRPLALQAPVAPVSATLTGAIE